MAASTAQATGTRELLRFSTAGSVDDGKSTLIGRLLHDARGVYEDQLASVHRDGALDFALITDGLRAEREQGITIDVAYRYFSTGRRKFIIADTPGHEQYTRNMATGASTADLAVILVDARNGVLPQSRRHAFIAALLGIRHIVVAVNKMDLVGFREEVFDQIRAEFSRFAAQLQLGDVLYIPISALDGDNVVVRSRRAPWYRGPSLLEHLETVPAASDRNLDDFRFPVQYVIRPHQDFRGFAGQVTSGVVRPGDAVMVLPSGRASRVKSIVTYDGEIAEAFPPMSVTICLEDEVDISRGDMLVHPDRVPVVGRHFTADVVWMTDRPLDTHRSYLLKHTTQSVRAQIRRIRHRTDVNTLEHEPASTLRLNEIASIEFETARPLFFDDYGRNRFTGCFILIDPVSNGTVAAGMIRSGERQAAQSGNGTAAEPVTAAERHARYGHSPAVLWLPGAPELARKVERILFDRGFLVAVVEQGAVEPLLAAGAIAIAIHQHSPADHVICPLAGTVRGCVEALERHGIIPFAEQPLVEGGGI
jgi:sulfate adenylyltransferase large subunit